MNPRKIQESTEDILEAYMTCMRTLIPFATDQRLKARFYQWLNDERAKAYDEGYMDGWDAGWDDDDTQFNHDNPYRKENS